LMIAVSGFGFEMARPSIGNYFGQLLSEGPSNIVWAGPSSLVWENGGTAVAY
jgi:hypothetical protein